MNLYAALNHPVAMAIFALTLIAPVIVGFFAYRKTKSQADFLVGGRKVRAWQAALSAVASGRSSWLVVGVSGLAFARGVSAVWAVVGYIIVELFQCIFVGRKLRRECGLNNALTILDYFAARYNSNNLLRLVGATVMAIFLTSYVSAQFSAGAKSLAAATGTDFLQALLITSCMTMAYMLFGGYFAVLYNDVLRAVLMLFSLTVLPAVGLYKAGGLQSLLEALSRIDPALVDPLSLSTGTLIGFVCIGLGSPGQPHIVVRYMSVAHEDRLRHAALISTFCNVILAWGAIFVGLIGRAFFQPSEDPETAFLLLAGQSLSPALYGVMVGGLFAAILSTADSQLLVVASNIVRDIYETVLRRGRLLHERKRLRASRITLFAAGLIATLAALWAEDLVFWLVLFAWGGLGAAFGPTLLLSLFWPRTSPYGVLLGFILGPAVVIIFRVWLKEATGLYELVPGFFVSAFAVILISLAHMLRQKYQRSG